MGSQGVGTNLNDDILPWCTMEQSDETIEPEAVRVHNDHSNAKEKDLLATINKRYSGFDQIVMASSNHVHSLALPKDRKAKDTELTAITNPENFKKPMDMEINPRNKPSPRNDVNGESVGQEEINGLNKGEINGVNNGHTNGVNKGQTTERSVGGLSNSARSSHVKPRTKRNSTQKAFGHEERDMVLDDLEDF